MTEKCFCFLLLLLQRALSFLNNDGNLRHNNVSVWSVFVNSSGEWKLGGLEYVSNVDGNQLPPVKLPSSLEIYDPPEKNDTSKLKLATKWYATTCTSTYIRSFFRIPFVFHFFSLIVFTSFCTSSSSSDMWGLGIIVWESFNGPLRNRSNLKDVDNVCIFHISSMPH